MSEKYVEWFVRVVPPRGSQPNNTLGNIRVAATTTASQSVELDNDVGLFAFVSAGPVGNSTQSIGPAILRVQAELADVYINFSFTAGTANSSATAGNTRASIVPAGQDRDFEINPSVDKFLNFATIATGATAGFIRYWVTTFPQSSSVFGAQVPYRPARMVRPWERFLPGMFFTGSHGVAPPFTPNLIPGLLLWLRGDLGVTLNGSNVSAWADQSGNLNNFTQATAIRQPPTNTVINGKPCVVFDGTTAMTAVNFIGVGAKTIVLIRKYALSTGINQALLLLMSGTTVNKVNYVSTDVSATYQPLQFFCDWTASIAGRKTVPAMDASPHMDFMDYNGGTNNVNASYDAWIDGTSSVISNGGTFGGEVLSNLTSIGQNVNSSGALVSPAVVTACSVAEVLVWGRQLTSTERNKLGGYVQTRYAITIAGATF